MVRCDMCGMEVPVGPNGTCFLGHALGNAAVVSAPAAPPPAASVPPAAPVAVVDALPPVAAPLPPVPEPVVRAEAPIGLAPAAEAGPPPGFTSTVSPEMISAAVAEAADAPGDAVAARDSADPAVFEPPATDPPQGPPASQPGFTTPKPLGGAPAPAFQAPRPLGSTPSPVPTAAAQSEPTPAPAQPPAPLNAPLAAPAQAPVPSMPSTRPPAPVPPSAPPSMPSTQPFAASVAPAPTAPPTPAPVLAEPFAAPATSGTAALAVAPTAVSEPSAVTHGDLFVVASAPSGRRVPSKPLLLVLVVALLGGAAFAAKSFLGTGSDAAPVGGAGMAAARVDEAGSLARAFVDGDTHGYRMTATIHTTMRRGTESESFDASVDMSFTEKVIANDDGTTTIRYTFTNATMKADGRQVPVPFTPGVGMEVVVGSDGKIDSVNTIGGDEMPVDGSFYEMLAPVLPPDAKPGDRWSRVDNPEVPNVGAMEVKTAFHYVKDEGGNAIVDSSSEAPFDLGLGAEALEAFGGADGSFEMRGRLLSTGRQIVDKASGRTLSADGTIAITFAMLQNGQEAARMAMHMKFRLGPAAVKTA